MAHIRHVLDRAKECGLAPRTIAQLRAVTSSMFSTALEWELVETNPVRGTKVPTPSRPDLEIPTTEEVLALIEAARGTPWEIPVLLTVTMGTRRSETLGLSWSGVDLDRGRVSVTRNLQRVPGAGLQFFPPKSSRSRRVVILPPFVIPALRAHRKAQAERRLLLGSAWQDHDLVSDRGDGAPLDPNASSSAVKRLMRKAGTPP